MIGNEEDFTAALGFEVEGVDENITQTRDVDGFKQMIETVRERVSDFSVVATTLRKAKTATQNDWGAICYADGKILSGDRIARISKSRPRRRRRLFRLRLDLRIPASKDAAIGRRMRRRPRRARDDHARRHDDGDAGRSAQADEGPIGPHRAIKFGQVVGPPPKALFFLSVHPAAHEDHDSENHQRLRKCSRMGQVSTTSSFLFTYRLVKKGGLHFFQHREYVTHDVG